jgi:hypothetical protein
MIQKVTIDLKDDKASATDKEAVDQALNDSKLKRALSN